MYKHIAYLIILLNICNYCNAFYTLLPSNCRFSSHRRIDQVNPHSYHKSYCSSDLNQPMNTNNITKINKNYSTSKDLCEPYIDMELIKKTIKQWTRPLPTSYISRPMVIVGPSCVGKGRLIKALLRDYNRFFQKVVTHTTRNPRPDEINGTSYHYITNDTFQTLLANSSDYFIEHAQVHTNYYGISYHSLQHVIQKNKIPILEIDIQGAKTIQEVAYKYDIKPWFIFIAPPDINMLIDRLQKRGTENDNEINIRLNNAKHELIEANLLNNKLFKYIIINDNFQQTINLLFRIVRDEYAAIPSASRIRMLQRRLKKMKQVTSLNNYSIATTTTITNNNIDIIYNKITDIIDDNDDKSNRFNIDNLNY